MIKELFDLGSLIGSIFKSDKEKKNIQTSGYLLSQIAGKSNSIAKMASKTIHNYPVVITNAFGDDVTTAFKILKYAESVFAYFLIMSIGLEPKVDNAGNSIAIHLNRFSAEDWDAIEKLGKIRIEIDLNNSGSVSNYTETSLEELYRNASQDYYDHTTKIKKWDRVYAREDILDSIKYEEETVKDGYEFTPGATGRYYDTETKRETNDQGIYIDRRGNAIQNPNKPGTFIYASNWEEGSLKEKTKVVAKDVLELRKLDKFCDSIDKRMGKSLPTTFTVNFYIGEQVTPVTLSAKAIPHFIDSEEMKGIFKRVTADERLSIKLIRLRTGEISFFKDFLLSWNQIKSDQEFFQRVGRHSWYRKLLDRKLNSKTKGLLGLIDGLKQFLNKQTILPTVTLVTTTNEISDAISYPYLEAVRKGQITKIIDSLMLLALIVYDPDREVVHCHFNGIPHAYIIPVKDLKEKSDKSDVTEILESMNKLMMKSY